MLQKINVYYLGKVYLYFVVKWYINTIIKKNDYVARAM